MSMISIQYYFYHFTAVWWHTSQVDKEYDKSCAIMRFLSPPRIWRRDNVVQYFRGSLFEVTSHTLVERFIPIVLKTKKCNNNMNASIINYRQSLTTCTTSIISNKPVTVKSSKVTVRLRWRVDHLLWLVVAVENIMITQRRQLAGHWGVKDRGGEDNFWWLQVTNWASTKIHARGAEGRLDYRSASSFCN